MPDGICNPVRHKFIRCDPKISRTGCKPRPAQSDLIKSGTIKLNKNNKL
ncbi:Uncharacterized protein dnm_060430 [Desulfonema magnum]|uniref:Uncharacterized protein n=1 Tax=Desulfonema magnum TaxID=45655 RepID=A0A975GRG4_9BACT|nr:Uncharacterized protein dnm_060430 [Desulfonema magnum]